MVAGLCVLMVIAVGRVTGQADDLVELVIGSDDQLVSPNSTLAGEQFGQSLLILDDLLFVGAPGPVGTTNGRVYVFRAPSGAGLPEYELTLEGSPTGVANTGTQYGSSLSGRRLTTNSGVLGESYEDFVGFEDAIRAWVVVVGARGGEGALHVWLVSENEEGEVTTLGLGWIFGQLGGNEGTGFPNSVSVGPHSILVGSKNQSSIRGSHVKEWQRNSGGGTWMELSDIQPSSIVEVNGLGMACWTTGDGVGYFGNEELGNGVLMSSELNGVSLSDGPSAMGQTVVVGEDDELDLGGFGESSLLGAAIAGSKTREDDFYAVSAPGGVPEVWLMKGGNVLGSVQGPEDGNGWGSVLDMEQSGTLFDDAVAWIAVGGSDGGSVGILVWDKVLSVDGELEWAGTARVDGAEDDDGVGAAVAVGEGAAGVGWFAIGAPGTNGQDGAVYWRAVALGTGLPWGAIWRGAGLVVLTLAVIGAVIFALDYLKVRNEGGRRNAPLDEYPGEIRAQRTGPGMGESALSEFSAIPTSDGSG